MEAWRRILADSIVKPKDLADRLGVDAGRQAGEGRRSRPLLQAHACPAAHAATGQPPPRWKIPDQPREASSSANIRRLGHWPKTRATTLQPTVQIWHISDLGVHIHATKRIQATARAPAARSGSSVFFAWMSKKLAARKVSGGALAQPFEEKPK